MKTIFITKMIFTGYDRVLTKYYFEEAPVMRKNCENRIAKICSTAIFHTLEHYEAKLVHREEISTPPIKNSYKLVIDEEDIH